MKQIHEATVERLHNGPEGPMLPYITYQQYSLATNNGIERAIHAPATAGQLRKQLTQLALRGRVAFENMFVSNVYDDPSTPKREV